MGERKEVSELARMCERGGELEKEKEDGHVARASRLRSAKDYALSRVPRARPPMIHPLRALRSVVIGKDKDV